MSLEILCLTLFLFVKCTNLSCSENFFGDVNVLGHWLSNVMPCIMKISSFDAVSDVSA